MSDDEDVVCIYCLLTKRGSREHLVQRSIGGNLTGRRVCRECNTGMSDIDQHLGDNAVVSMLRVANTPKAAFAVKLGGEQFTTDPAGRKVPVALRNQYEPALHPMMRFTPKAEGGVEVGVHFSEHQDAARFAKFLEKHRRDSFAKLFDKVVDWLGAGEAAVVMHREDDGYLATFDGPLAHRARVLLNEKADELLAFLHKPLPEGAPLEQPFVSVSSELRLNDLYRAVAKLAFNLFAHRTPDGLALSADFHDVREYIRGRDIRSVTGTDGAIEPDGRFVTWAVNGTPMVFRDMEHTVAISVHESQYIALVTLYRSLVFVVTLGPVRGTPPWFSPQVLVVRGDRQETRWLDLQECVDLVHEDPAI